MRSVVIAKRSCKTNVHC